MSTITFFFALLCSIISLIDVIKYHFIDKQLLIKYHISMILLSVSLWSLLFYLLT